MFQKTTLTFALACGAIAMFAGCQAPQGPVSSGEATNNPSQGTGPRANLDTIGVGGAELDRGSVRLTNAERHDYAHPHVSYDGKWMAYSATINRKQPDVFVQAMGGAAARQITWGGGSNIHPQISPDSGHVAFASDRDGKFRIFISPLNGVGGMEEVSDPMWEAISPTWAPNGKRLAFATRRSKDSPWMIAVKDRTNGSMTYLTEGMFPDWSPFGEHICFQRNSRQDPGYTSIYSVRSDGSELTEVYHSDSHGAITPAWAGDWILFATVNKSVASRTRNNFAMFNADDIWIVHRDGSQARILTQHRQADWDPCYDVQGRRVVFVSLRDQVQNIYAVSLNTAPAAISHSSHRASTASSGGLFPASYR